MTDAAITKGEHTRDAILRSAYGFFLRQGYHGTSMRQIAQEAGIALGAIYNHFPNKETLFVAILAVNHPIHTILPSLRSVQGVTVEELIRDAASLIVCSIENNQNFLNLVFIEQVEFNGKHIPDVLTNLLPLVMEFIQRLYQVDGGLRPIPPMILLRSFVGLLFSYVFTGLMVGKHPQMDTSPAILEAFVDIYLHGVLAKEG